MEDKILDIIESVSNTNEVRQNRDIDLFATGLCDSLGFVELLVALEEVLGVTIEPSEIERGDFDTPNKIINYVTNKANKNITAQRANN